MRWLLSTAVLFGVASALLKVERQILGDEAFQSGSGRSVGYGELKEEWRGEIIHLSWSPRAYLLKGLLTGEECDHLIEKAKPRMVKSTVVDSNTGRSVPSDVRTSSGTFLGIKEDEVIARLEKRVAQVTMIPQEHQEGFQILHYQDGQEYKPHHDFFYDPLNAAPEKGGQRVITVLMYLTDVDEGGETVFPNADKAVTGDQWSECAKKGLAVKAKRGDAVMFYSLRPDGSTDASSLHGSCPTTSGNKWSATKWIHVAPLRKKIEVAAKSACRDKEDSCAEWAFFGECEKNPDFMASACMKSCRKCPDDQKAAEAH